MENSMDPVEFIEKYFGIKLMECQKAMIRKMDKNDEFIRGHRLSNQESLYLSDDARVDLDAINTVLEPFRVEAQSFLDKKVNKNVD